MLNFDDALNNDNPVSDELNIAALAVWYCAAPLILSNLAGTPLAVYCHRHSLFFLAAADFGAIVVSLLYHTCQTTHVCFGISLSVWTLADHISAPMYMVALILFIINTKSSKQRRVEIRRRYHMEYGHHQHHHHQYYQSRVYHASLDNVSVEQPPPLDEYMEIELDEDEIEERESTKTYYQIGYGNAESNDENNAWGVYTMYSSLLVVILAALAHNFSLQAFLISFSYCLGVIFFKVVIVDEGDALNMYERVSLIDLILGVVLILISLVFYMLDIYVAYPITHSLWHVFSFTGSYFLTIGLTRHIDGWYSPAEYLCGLITRKCLHRQSTTH